MEFGQKNLLRKKESFRIFRKTLKMFNVNADMQIKTFQLGFDSCCKKGKAVWPIAVLFMVII